MAEVKNKPPGLPSGNDLDKHKIPKARAELRLGQNVLFATDNPPDLRETRDVVVRLRCVRKGTEALSSEDDSDETEYRAMKLVSAWFAGDPVPSDPAMIDDEGKVDPDATTEGTDPRTGKVNHLSSVPDPADPADGAGDGDQGGGEPGDDESPI